jgi:hypothetical protein
MKEVDEIIYEDNKKYINIVLDADDHSDILYDNPPGSNWKTFNREVMIENVIDKMIEKDQISQFGQWCDCDNEKKSRKGNLSGVNMPC